MGIWRGDSFKREAIFIITSLLLFALILLVLVLVFLAFTRKRARAHKDSKAIQECVILYAQEHGGSPDLFDQMRAGGKGHLPPDKQEGDTSNSTVEPLSFTGNKVLVEIGTALCISTGSKACVVGSAAAFSWYPPAIPFCIGFCIGGS